MRIIKACLLIALFALALSSGAAGEIISDYELYLSDLIFEFEMGEYELVSRIYAEICEIWPDATTHTGGAVDYAQYAKGRVYMANYDYAAARLAFASLRDDFPAQVEGCPKAGDMIAYCEGWVRLNMGERERAIESFYSCRGTLDASALYEQLSLSAQSRLEGLRLAQADHMSLSLSWSDTLGFDSYSVSYAPVGSSTRTQVVKVDAREARLTGLLPNTRYAVSVTPVSDEQGAVIPVTAEFDTLDAPDYIEDDLYLRRADICQYNSRMAKRVGLDMIVGLLNDGVASDAYTLIDDETVSVPVRKLTGGAYGYFVRYSLQYAASAQGKQARVRLVLRPETQGAYELVDEFTLDSPSYTGRYVVIDELLDEVYENSGGWPEGYCILDYYLNDLYLGTQYLNITSERRAR